MFDFDHEKYPLLHQIDEEGYILEAKLNPGDCLYIPAWYWNQSRTLSHSATLLHFRFEEASVLSNLFFDAINEGVLDEQKRLKK